jgi:glycine cleavage system H protein
MVVLLVLVTLAVFFTVELIMTPGRERRGTPKATAAPRAQHGPVAGVRGLHAGHTWARVNDPNDAVLGVTDLGPRLLGRVERVDVAPVGTRVRQGEPFVTLHRGHRALQHPAPLSGVVVEVNAALKRQADLVNESPFESGWIARIEPEDPWTEMDNLLRGVQAERWQDVLHMELAHWFAPLAGPAMADGGEAVMGLGDRLSDTEWERLVEAFYPRPLPNAVDPAELK